MIAFRYRALRADGGIETGRLDAAGRAEALAEVAGRGWTPLQLDADETPGNGGARVFPSAAAALSKLFAFRARRIAPAQVEDFLRGLSSLLAAGVPLSRALELLARETAQPGAAAVWGALRDRVVDGLALAASMERAGGVFSRAQIAMVEAGEAGGFLDVVLGQIADFLTRDRDLRSRTLAALIYPAVLFTLAVAVLSYLLVFFIPKFQVMFEGFDAPLPGLTLAIVAVSNGLRRYGIWLAAAIALGVGALRRRLREDAGRRGFERRLLAAPVIGPIARGLAAARFCRMLGSLLAAGVSLTQALRAARRTLGYRTLMDLLDDALDGVQKGESLAVALGRGAPELFGRSTLEMIAVAEESGRLDRELARLADDMERTLDRRLRMAVALTEPALLFVIAALVGLIFIGMVLPIFTLQEYIR